VLAGLWFVFAALATTILVEDHSPGGLIGGGVIFAAAFCTWTRALVSHVRLSDERLTYVGYARTHRVPWTEVAAVELTALDSASSLDTVSLAVRRTNGTEVVMPAVAGFAFSGGNRRLERLCRECEQRVWDAGGRLS
jgi:hypothetical protein